MYEILINKHDELGEDIVQFIEKLPNIQVTTLSPQNFLQELDSKILKSFDYIIDTEGDEEKVSYIRQYKHQDAIFISKNTLLILRPLLNRKKLHVENLELLMNYLQDAVLFININGNVEFINDKAMDYLQLKKDPVGKHVTEIMVNNDLEKVLQNKQVLINEMYLIDQTTEVIATHIPIRNESKLLLGALAIWKDAKELKAIVEENIEIKEMQSMLEAIIQSSNEAISVVDEKGYGLLINPAYTKTTGLSEENVIGKPATADISQGDSVHMKVLQTRRPMKGEKLWVGPNKKEVIVNAAPIIVQGKLKGSVAVIHDVSNIQTLTQELNRAKQIIRNLEATYSFEDIIGNSSELALSIEQAKIAAKTDATVLLRGESGTGKELFAHAIHNASDRKDKKFIRVNCAAIAESVLESELFGYVEGAFTGAKRGGKAGLFEEANYGTIFLDEIGDLSFQMQSKILRVLQEKEITRVGSTTPIPLNIRIITATNVNLENAIRNNKFREDLYYRLNRLPIIIPPLRERTSDMALLVNYLIAKVNQQYGKKVKAISKSALQALNQHHWPGNVRELENVISRAIIFMDISDETIQYEHLPPLTFEGANNRVHLSTDVSLQEAIDQYEKEYIEKVYKQNNYHKTNTAKQLQISVRNLYYKLEKYRIE